MNTVLVTGAGGFIGSVLIPKLLSKGYRVQALDRFFFGEEVLEPHSNLTLIKDDTRRIDISLFDQVDAIVDLVAISNDPSGELFEQATWQINHSSRARTAKLAKLSGVKRYILPSSCSVYGCQEQILDESSPTYPLTNYARANKAAEDDILPLASEDFCVTVIRQATLFGYSPRMRFDLAINGMVEGAFSTGRLPLMRDGTQQRPMIHVQDATDVIVRLLTTSADLINGEIFNVGSEANNYRLSELGDRVATIVGERLGREIAIEWYGEADHRSYCVNFSKLNRLLKWQPQWHVERGSLEIIDKLVKGITSKTPKTITLQWYQELTRWHQIIKSLESYGGIIDIDDTEVKR